MMSVKFKVKCNGINLDCECETIVVSSGFITLNFNVENIKCFEMLRHRLNPSTFKIMTNMVLEIPANMITQNLVINVARYSPDIVNAAKEVELQYISKRLDRYIDELSSYADQITELGASIKAINTLRDSESNTERERAKVYPILKDDEETLRHSLETRLNNLDFELNKTNSRLKELQCRMVRLDTKDTLSNSNIAAIYARIKRNIMYCNKLIEDVMIWTQKLVMIN